jgi:hypothetical protein
MVGAVEFVDPSLEFIEDAKDPAKQFVGLQSTSTQKRSQDRPQQPHPNSGCGHIDGGRSECFLSDQVPNGDLDVVP